eukprot:5896496-Pleurochrysis_carterae.AAC.1
MQVLENRRGKAGGVWCICAEDITKDGAKDLLVGRDDGVVEAWRRPAFTLHCARFLYSASARALAYAALVLSLVCFGRARSPPPLSSHPPSFSSQMWRLRAAAPSPSLRWIRSSSLVPAPCRLALLSTRRSSSELPSSPPYFL